MQLHFKKWFFGYAFLGALFSFFLFFKLGHYSFWQDEADQALLSLSILKTGWPLALLDGKFITQWHGQESTAHYLWFFNPWFPLYLVAGSFKLFGISEWSARFPFALFGLFSLIPLGMFFWKWTKNHAITGLALFFFVTNVWVILYMRQAKYFGIVFFAYGLMLLSRRWLYAIGFILLFHCNYLAAILSAAGLVLYTRKKSFLFLNFFLFVVFCLPFFFVGSMESRLKMTSHWPTFGQYFTKLLTQLFYFNRQVAPLILLPFWIVSWRKEKWFQLILISIAVGWLTIPLLNYDVLRYNLHLIPLFCFLLACTIARIYRNHRVWGLGCFIILWGTNLFQKLPETIQKIATGSESLSLKKDFLKEEWWAIKNYYIKEYADPPKILPQLVKQSWRPGEYVYLNSNQPVWQFYSDIPLAWQAEPNKAPSKIPPLKAEWTDPKYVDWWIGPDLVKLGNGPYVSEKEIVEMWQKEGFRNKRIDSGIPVLNWSLNSPIRYKHFLTRFSDERETPESITLFQRVKRP